MLREHRARVVVDLHLPANLEARTLEAEVEAADPAEQAAHGHRPQSAHTCLSPL